MTSHPLPVLAGVYYSIISATAQGHPTNNIFTFQVTPAPVSGAPDVAAAVDVANAIHTRWATFAGAVLAPANVTDRKSTRLNSSHPSISYAVFCLKKKKKKKTKSVTKLHAANEPCSV